MLNLKFSNSTNSIKSIAHLLVHPVNFDVKFIKKDKAQQISYGVALSPNLHDFDGDVIIRPEVIAKGSHDWLANSRKMNLFHRHKLDEWQSVPVESYITTHDIMVKDDDFIPCYPHYIIKDGIESLLLYTVSAIDITKDDTQLPYQMVLSASGDLNKDRGEFISKDNGVVEYVPKGSWFLVVHTPDRGLWKMIEEGKIMGFSVEGRAEKKDIEI